MVRSLPTQLDETRESCETQIAVFKVYNAALKTRVADLEAKLRINSRNSSKPPSADGAGLGGVELDAPSQRVSLGSLGPSDQPYWHSKAELGASAGSREPWVLRWPHRRGPAPPQRPGSRPPPTAAADCGWAESWVGLHPVGPAGLLARPGGRNRVATVRVTQTGPGNATNT